MSDSLRPWAVAHQNALSKGFSMQEYCSGLPFPTPGDLPDQGIRPTSLLSPALAGGLFTLVPLMILYLSVITLFWGVWFDNLKLLDKV